MMKRQLGVIAALVLIALVGGIIWFTNANPAANAARAEGGRTSPPTPAATGSALPPTASTPRAGTSPQPTNGAPAGAAPTGPATGGASRSSASDAAVSAAIIPAHAVTSCAGVRGTLTAFGNAGRRAGPAGFSQLLIGLEEFATNVEARVATNPSFAPVIGGISDVRRQWSTSLAATDGGSTADAARSAQEGIDTLQRLASTLTCK